MSSSSSSSATARVGPGFLGLLTLLLVAGKLFVPATATYSWLVAFAPVLLGVAIFFLIILMAGVIAFGAYFLDRRDRKKRLKHRDEIRKTRTL